MPEVDISFETPKTLAFQNPTYDQIEKDLLNSLQGEFSTFNYQVKTIN
jgi:hypothetical protein